MKKIIKMTMFSAAFLFWSASPVFSILEAAAEGNVSGYILTNTDSTVTEDEKKLDFIGPGASVYIHWTFGFPEVLTIGLGPSFDLAAMKYYGNLTGMNTFLNIRGAAELMVTLDIVPKAMPFVRLGYGYEYNGFDKEYSGISLPVIMQGGSLHANMGVVIPIIPLVRISLEGGIVSGTLSTSTEDPSGTILQTYLDSINKSEYNHFGWRAGLGVQISI